VVALGLICAPLASATTAGAVKAKLPGRPAITSVVPGPGSLTIAWQSGTPGSQATVGFRVMVSQAGVTIPACAGATKRSCTISGLTPGRAAKVSVAERSALGIGAPATAKATPTGVPASPTGLAVQRVGSTLVASWKAGAANGSPITGFLVGAVSATGASLGGCPSLMTSTATSCTFVGASGADSYVVSVAGENAVGTGRAATLSVSATSPSGPTSRLLASSISLSQRWVQPGGRLTVTGSHFARSATIQLSARRTTPLAARSSSPRSALAVSTAGMVSLGSLTADAYGAVSGSITIPTTLPAGSSSSFEIVASGADDAGVIGSVTAPVLIGFDTTGPQLLGADAAQPLMISSSGTDTSFGPQTVTITAEVTDDLSGVRAVTLWPASASAPALDCGGAWGAAVLIAGDAWDGIWQQTCTARQYIAGTYRVTAMASDQAGTSSFFGWTGLQGGFTGGADLGLMGYVASSLTVSMSHPEVTATDPPILDPAGSSGAITLAAHEVTLTPGHGATIPLSFGFTSSSAPAAFYSFGWSYAGSPPPGATWPNMGAGTPPGGLGEWGSLCSSPCAQHADFEGHLASGSLNQGVFTTLLRIPAETVDGVYELHQAEIQDALGNWSGYGPTEKNTLDSLGYTEESLSIVVHSSGVPARPSGSQMLDAAHGGILSLSTNAIDSVAGPQSIDVTIGGYSADAGYNVAAIYIEFTDGTKTLTAAAGTWLRATALPDVVTMTLGIPQFADPGTWHISSILIQEYTPGGEVADGRRFDPVQLGFDPSAFTFTNQHLVGS
jgi:hypothetical protein